MISLKNWKVYLLLTKNRQLRISRLLRRLFNIKQFLLSIAKTWAACNALISHLVTNDDPKNKNDACNIY